MKPDTPATYYTVRLTFVDDNGWPVSKLMKPKGRYAQPYYYSGRARATAAMMDAKAALETVDPDRRITWEIEETQP